MRSSFMLMVLCALITSCGIFKGTPQVERQNTLDAETEFKRNTLFYKALVRYHAKEFDAARELLLLALDIDSTAAEVHHKLGQIILKVSSPRDTAMMKQAFHHAQLATHYAPHNKEYISLYAFLLLERKRYEEALGYQEQLTALAPTTENYYNLSQTYMQLKRYDEALQAMNHIENMDGDILPVVQEKARIFAAKKDTTALFTYLKDKVNKNQDDPHFLRVLNDYHVAFNHADSAEALYLDFLKKDPNNVVCQMGLFFIYIANFPEREQTTWRSLEQIMLNPLVDEETKIQFLTYMEKLLNDKKMPLTPLYALLKKTINTPLQKAEIPYYYSYLMEKDNMPLDSIAKVMERAIEIEPGRSDLRRDYILILYSQQKIFEVVRAVKDAQKFIPGFLWLYYFEALLRQEEQDMSVFVEILERGIKLNTDKEDELLPTVYVYLGDAYQDLNNYEKAFEAYDNCLAIDPYHANCLNNYAYFLALRQERLDEAEEMACKVMDIEPNNPTYIDTYAWILYLQGKYPQAKIHIDKTIELLNEKYEGEATLLDHAGDIYLKCNETEAAREFWEKALKVSDDAQETKAIQKKLKRHQ